MSHVAVQIIIRDEPPVTVLGADEIPWSLRWWRPIIISAITTYQADHQDCDEKNNERTKTDEPDSWRKIHFLASSRCHKVILDIISFVLQFLALMKDIWRTISSKDVRRYLKKVEVN